ncbi:PDGLE domain-containing protein [Actinopolymorpha sp. NPDC004070]|uniref:PDGLE domain-containing protein n=1 Tax=Actinopolymorpha sp. NPDC004070 TaxID=3154548 RepID=UPI0033B815DD
MSRPEDRPEGRPEDRAPAGETGRRGPRTRVIVVVGLLVVLALAGGVSYYASASPDGLNKVAEDHGFASTAKDSPTRHSPFAGYGVRGITDGRASTAVAGVAGVAIVLALGTGVALAVRRRDRRGDHGGDHDGDHNDDHGAPSATMAAAQDASAAPDRRQ